MTALGGLRSWEDIELIYAGQRIANDHTLRDYHVPPVRFRGSSGRMFKLRGAR